MKLLFQYFLFFGRKGKSFYGRPLLQRTFYSVNSGFALLNYLPVTLSDNEGNQCLLDGLSDSGAEVALANTSAIANLNPIDIGSVKIKSVTGKSISVPLKRLNVILAQRPECCLCG